MARWLFIATVWMIFGTANLRAQESTPPVPQIAPKNYRVELVEFRVTDPDTEKLSTREIVKVWDRLRADGQLTVVDAFDLVTVPGQEATLHDGLRLSVTEAVAFTQQGRARQTRGENLGTIAKLTLLDRVGNGFLLQLSYESSRHQDPIPDDAPPTTSSFQLRSTVVIELGQPLIIAGSRLSGSSMLRILVEE